MATLYQLHSTMDNLRRSSSEMALTWRAGDSILLLGSTVAFIEWLEAYLDESDIDRQTIEAVYALADDIAQLSAATLAKLDLHTKLTGILTDEQWVAMTQNIDVDADAAVSNTDIGVTNAKFDKVVTIAL